EDAARYAETTGELLVRLREQADDADAWSRWEIGDEGDFRANRHLLELLHAEHPDDVVFSEESADDRRRLDADRVWIIDRLDGSPLEYNRADPYVPDLLVCRPELADAVLAAVR